MFQKLVVKGGRTQLINSLRDSCSTYSFLLGSYTRHTMELVIFQIANMEPAARACPKNSFAIIFID